MFARRTPTAPAGVKTHRRYSLLLVLLLLFPPPLLPSIPPPGPETGRDASRKPRVPIRTRPARHRVIPREAMGVRPDGWNFYVARQTAPGRVLRTTMIWYNATHAAARGCRRGVTT